MNAVETAKKTNRPSVLYYLMHSIGGGAGDWLVLAVGMTLAALAFLWAGYLGNPTDPQFFIRQPWTLFGLFFLAMIVLEAAILLNPHLHSTWKPSRAKVVATIVVSCAWAVIVAAIYVRGIHSISDLLQQILPSVSSATSWLGTHKQLIFIAINFASIVIIWLGIRLSWYDPAPAEANQEPGFRGERFAGDLLISTFFSVLLAWAFFWPFWQGGTTVPAATQSQHIAATTGLTACDLTFLPFPTPCTLTPFDLSTIFMLDVLILPLFYLGIALIILLFVALQRVVERDQPKEFPTTFLNALRDLVKRRITLPNLLLALRYFWPGLLLAATVLIGVASKAIAQYLYNVGSASHGHVLWLDFGRGDSATNLALQFGAVTALLVALVATVVASTLQLLPRPKRGTNLRRELLASALSSWSHVSFFGLILAVSYWGFSLAFSIINLLSLIGVREVEIVNNNPLPPGYHWAPFVQPDPLMVLSLAVFLFFAYLKIRQAGRRTPQREPQREAVHSHVEEPRQT
jgi:hypothetical protein